MLPLLLLLSAASPDVLSLADAERIALEESPVLAQAAARSRGADARADSAAASLLPEVSATAGYQRGTVNKAPTTPSFDGVNALRAGLDVDQLIWDFGRTTGRVDAARQTARARAHDQDQVRREVLAAVRQAYFNAVAARALRDIARASLDNQRRHQEQIEAFVDVGRRPEIDRAQIQAQVANARVDVVNADAAWNNTRVTLARAVGLHRVPADVQSVLAPPVDGEDAAFEALRDEAIAANAELKSLTAQLASARRSVDATRGDYWPSLSVNVGASAAGAQLDGLAPNASAGVSMRWPLFSGLSTVADVRAAEEDQLALAAVAENTRLQVEADVEQARMQLLAAREAVAATVAALDDARTRLGLAEARYAQGAGSIVELADAQLAHDQVAAKKVQAEANLSGARALLLLALGR